MYIYLCSFEQDYCTHKHISAYVYILLILQETSMATNANIYLVCLKRLLSLYSFVVTSTGMGCSILGSVDSYGHFIVSPLDTSNTG